MQPLSITQFTLTSALGRGQAAHLEALRSEKSGLSPTAFETCTLPTWTGQVAGLDQPLPRKWADWDCRNNRLAYLALAQDGFRAAVQELREVHGADRIGVFIGTSTAGVQQTELAYRMRQQHALPDWFRYRETQNTFSPADFVRRQLELDGVCLAKRRG